MRKKLIILGFLTFAIAECFAWGATGHRATGRIAEQYLNAKAKKKISLILEGESVAMVSNWMDEILSDSLYNFTDWHWSTIPDGGKYEDIESNPNQDGKMILMLEKIIKELKSGNLTPKQEREYLKIVIHLVGDIHQPMHVGRPGDKGGNNIKVKWFRNDSNLHRVWDSDMINDSRLSFSELADAIVKPDAVVVAKWQKNTVRDWAKEDVNLRDQVYKIGDGNLGYEYTYRNFGLVKQRILQGGIRLAGVLNEIYGK